MKYTWYKVQNEVKIIWGFIFCCWVVCILYILCILILYQIYDKYITNTLSHSVGCLFTLLMVSVAVQKLFSLRQLPLFIFHFIACALGIISSYHFQDPHQGPMEQRFLCFPLGVSGNPKVLTVILYTGFWGIFPLWGV